MCDPGFLAQTEKERYRKAPLSRKTSYATRVAPQHCPALHMSKRKFMVLETFFDVNVLSGPISPRGWPYLSVTAALKLREGWPFKPKFVSSSPNPEGCLYRYFFCLPGS